MRAAVLRMTRRGVVLAMLLIANAVRAEDYEVLVGLGAAAAVTVGLVNVGFTAYDVAMAARRDVPRPGVAFAEVGIMALEVGAISAVSVALDPRDPLPLFAVSLWPAALMVHGIWALTADRPALRGTESRTASLELVPSMAWAKDGPRVGVLGRF
jgi:hypothetical protein